MHRMLDRYPGDTPTDVIKVDLGTEGLGATAEVNNQTQTISIIPPPNMTEEQLKTWTDKIQDASYLNGIARKKLMELNQATETRSTELSQREQELNTLQATLQEKQRKLDQALANLGNPPSNPTEIEPLFKFLGLSDPSELPDFISNNPDKYLQKTDERLRIIAKAESQSSVQTTQAAQNIEAIKQQASIDGLDMTDFINNYCIPQGITIPNQIAYQNYKKIMQTGNKSTEKIIQDISKYTMNIMPSGSHAFDMSKGFTQEEVDAMTPAQRNQYRDFLEKHPNA